MKYHRCRLPQLLIRLTTVSLALLAIADHVEAQGRPFPYVLRERDLVIVPAFFGLARWGESLRDGHEPITPSQIEGLARQDVNWFDRVATHNWSSDWSDRSDAYRDVLVRAAILFSGGEAVYWLSRGQLTAPLVLATMFAEVYLCVEGVTYMTKGISGRMRPYVYNTSMSVDERYAIASSSDNNDVFSSFYSGHAAAAFAAATFTSKLFTDIHGKSTWSYLVWGSTLSMAAMAAYARVEAGVHFPSDVMAGAVAGGVIGYLVPVVHKRSAADHLSINILPTRMSLQVRF